VRLRADADGLPVTAAGSPVDGRRPTAVAHGQRALKRVSEVAVKHSVDERVERRVDVADPEQNGNDDRRRLRTVLAQRVVQVPREERQPTAEERAHDDAECLCCLVLAFHLPSLRSLRVRQRRRMFHSAAAHPLYGGRCRRRQCDEAVASRREVQTIDRRTDRHSQRLDELGLSLSGAEDLEVGDDHDDRREPKRDGA